MGPGRFEGTCCLDFREYRVHLPGGAVSDTTRTALDHTAVNSSKPVWIYLAKDYVSMMWCIQSANSLGDRESSEALQGGLCGIELG